MSLVTAGAGGTTSRLTARVRVGSQCGAATACCTRAAISSTAPLQTRKLQRVGALVRRRERRHSHRVTVRASSEAGMADDLLIIGPGVLGSYAGKLWLDSKPGSTVTGQTNSDGSHDRLRSLGITPTLRPEDPRSVAKYDNVLFSAPPSGSADYVAEVSSSLERWTGAGAFVFTSSASVVADDADEDSPLKPLGNSEQTDRLLLSEKAVMEAGGNVVRLVGLYHAQRGAHTFFLKKGEVERWGGYCINLIHYEDAASLAVAALQGGTRGQLYVGCDGVPVTLEEMMQAVAGCGNFEGSCTFTGEAGGDSGKRMSNGKTRAASSFAEFCAAGASDFYTSSGLF
eukprot:CAMPEP_0177784640 /NCGR_PEP_ID=MMETSP0491_2-20121128/19839_1 /TAXON_ID=63592 /ORGANISM="Tetraselmis chuii, Strain PLY429" /LENGTH=341 /DNA_ID=CAMNT_0019305481 /DNA_START=24 /DNA_END=1049 /DNA_ORIENTATION=+